MAAALVLSMVPSVSSASHSGRLSQTRRELRAARTRLASLVRNDRQLLGVIAHISGQLRRTQSRLYAARSHLAAIQTRIGAQEQRLVSLRAAQRRRSSVLQARARELYIVGPSVPVESFFQAGTFEEFVGRSATLTYVIRHDRVMIEDLQRVRHEAKVVRRALAVQRTEAAEVRDEIAERASLQAELLAARRTTQRRLRSQISEERSEIAALQREQGRILALIRARMARYGSTVSTGPVSRSGFTWPIQGRITSPYGPRWGGFHTGIDIDCSTGDGVGASKAGRVIAAEWGGGYGNMVIIDHGNGVTTLYAHQSATYVREGQLVAQRQRVGACGATGNATGSHLHFEVRVNGQHQNPRYYLP